MESSLRQRLTISLPARPVIDQPRGRVRRITVEPPGQDRLDALVGIPDEPQGLTFYFVGFNQSMGPWEAAKCALWAAYSHTTVVSCELPGFSRYGKGLPRHIRRDLMADDPSSWASLTWTYLRSAAAAAKVPIPDQTSVLGFSTGCSLAAAALPAIQAACSVSTLTLVEPVALGQRFIGRLAVHNVIDFLRIIGTAPRNRPSPWVWRALHHQTRAPGVRYSPADFLALITLLSGDDTQARLSAADLPLTNLARGTRSKLCPGAGFTELDTRLASRNIAGTTCMIAGFGHQLWHCMPAIDALARTLFPAEN
ncbi:MAG: hypothetical protein LBN10_09110 [Propionibacteriaceae bacterium]|jgi:hypothetical protein|nr:hypothetical protein [Propionibacteriaceae bacterium]